MAHNVDRQWFMDRWAERGLSLRRVAEMIDVDPGALSRTLKGERQMKILEVGKIATIMNVSRAEVLAHIEAMTATSGALSISEGDRGSAGDAGSPRASRHPGFGFMKGMITIEKGFDVTKPFDDQPWDLGYLGEGDRK